MRCTLSIICLFAAAALCAQPAPVVIAPELHIEAGENLELAVPAVTPPAGHRAVLQFLGRQDSPQPGGSLQVLGLTFNGTLLEHDRLVNKDRWATMGSGTPVNWFGGGSWRLLYSPDFVQADGPSDLAYCIIEGKAYEFELDVTDLLEPDGNTLHLRHRRSAPWRTIVLADLQIVFRTPDELPRPTGTAATAPVGPLEFIAPDTAPPPAFTAEMTSGGGIVLRCEGKTYHIESDFSYPGMGPRNTFTSDGTPPSGHPTWTVQEADGLHVRGSCRMYEVRRRLIPGDECLTVEDTIINRTDEDLGVIVRHSHRFPAEEAVEYRLGGIRPIISAMRRYGGGNPSSFVGLRDGGLALLPRDDIFRAHAFNFFEPGVIGIEDGYLAILPRGRHVLRWSVFPVPQGDYYDFVNAARRELGANFTLSGTFAFSHTARWMEDLDPDMAAQWAYNRSVRYVSNVIPRIAMEGGLRYAHGSALLMDDARPAIEKQHQVNEIIKSRHPGALSLTYFHSYISTEPGAIEKYAGTEARKPNGEVYDYHDPIYPLFIPTLENSYGEAMVRVIDMMLDDVGFDGIYWDEMSHSATSWAFDFPEWDGCSAEIDAATGEITRKLSSVTLLSQPFRQAMANRILDAGKALVANGQPLTETMAGYHFPRFVETGTPAHLYAAQLHSPIGLGDHLTEKTAADIAAQISLHLDYGCAYYFYFFDIPLEAPMLTAWMYPLTPMELRAGTIIAQERILTNRPGIYGWGEIGEHEVHVFDQTGYEVEFDYNTFERDGATWTELRLPAGYVAAIVAR